MKLAAFLLLCGLAALPGRAQTSRPNIIFLLTDDQRWNALGAMGDPIIKTPEIDSLSRQGVTFTHAYATTAICNVSRASIFTGQHLSRHGMGSFSSAFTPEALARIYPRVLRDSGGYFTGFIGKWGLGDQPASSFDKWWGFPGQGTYEIKTGGKVTGHLTPLMGDQALEFLDAAKAARKPFCLQLSFKAPHIQDEDPRQYIPDPADMGLYTDAVFPAPPLSDPAFFNSLPDFLKDPNTQLRIRWVKQFATPSAYQESMKNYYRLISGADKVVGRIRKKLAALGMDRNTVLIFASDHGYFIGDRGYSGKWMAYQASSRIPLIIYDPRFTPDKRGKRFQDLVLNLDIPETILGLAGVKAPKGMQGRNMMGLIDGTEKAWRSEFFFEHDYPDAAPPTKAVITHRYSYILYPKRSPVYEELYNLAADPNEAVNLAGKPEYKPILDSLRTRLLALNASVAQDDVVKELQMPVLGSATRISPAPADRVSIGKSRSGRIVSGRKVLTSGKGLDYDGSGRRVADPALERALFLGD